MHQTLIANGIAGAKTATARFKQVVKNKNEKRTDPIGPISGSYQISSRDRSAHFFVPQTA